MSRRWAAALFDIGSATYSVTRILTGQLDAYVDIGPAIIEAHPWVEAEFRRVGRGNVLCNSPYDLAAVHLLCREAGVPIGDAAGRSLEDKPVLGSRRRVPAGLHRGGQSGAAGGLVEVVQRGIRGLRRPAHAVTATSSDHEAMLYERLEDGAVRCRVCPRLCRIAPGKSGVCRARANRDGTLYAITYGRVCSVAADPIEKKPLYHFFPGTTVLSLGSVGCNFTCRHCQNWQIAHADPGESGARPARAAGPQPAGARRPQRLPGRGLDVQRAHHLARVHPRRRPARPRARPLHGDGHQRLHHRGGPRRAGAAHRRVPRRRQGLQRRAVPGAVPHPRHVAGARRGGARQAACTAATWRS